MLSSYPAPGSFCLRACPPPIIYLPQDGHHIPVRLQVSLVSLRRLVIQGLSFTVELDLLFQPPGHTVHVVDVPHVEKDGQGEGGDQLHEIMSNQDTSKGLCMNNISKK